MLTVKRLGSLPTHSSRLSEGVVTCHVTPLLDAVQVFHNSPNKSRHHSLAVNYHIYSDWASISTNSEHPRPQKHG